jgi:intergrase/recombinase
LKCNFLAIKEFEILDKDYYHYYFDFMRDYERTNPITRKKGNRNYIEKMREKGLISEEKFKEMTVQLGEDNLNVMEAYYRNNSSQRSKINVNRPKNNNLNHKYLGV